MKRDIQFYHYPELYSSLLFPGEVFRQTVKSWITTHLEGHFGSLLDPACGPGTWLFPFAKESIKIAGVDPQEKMIEFAEKALHQFDNKEIVQGDMCEIPFEDNSFDVALNLESSISHLQNDEEVCQHLREIHRCLRPHGLYILGLYVCDGEEADQEESIIFESGYKPIQSGGEVCVSYTSLFRDPKKRIERLHLQCLTKNTTLYPSSFTEEYELLTFPIDALHSLLESIPGFERKATYSMEVPYYPHIPLSKNCGDITLILQKAGRY